MPDVKWIKIVTDIFDDEKMLLIDGLPDCDAIIVIWFKLLCFAGKQNNGGVFILNDRIAYTDEMLATIFRRPLNVVRLALKTFEQYGMIEIYNGTITIPNWEKHQSLSELEKTREQTRKRVAKYREKQKQLADGNLNCNVTVTQCNTDRIREDTDSDKDIDIDADSDIEEDDSTPQAEDVSVNCPYTKIKELYHRICVSFPKIKAIDGNRKKAVGARWRTYKNLDTFAEMFRIAEASSFLKGQNDRNWSADFDWMMKPTNFSKIIEHKYDDRSPGETKLTGAIGILARMYEEAEGK